MSAPTDRCCRCCRRRRLSAAAITILNRPVLPRIGMAWIGARHQNSARWYRAASDLILAQSGQKEAFDQSSSSLMQLWLPVWGLSFVANAFHVQSAISFRAPPPRRPLHVTAYEASLQDDVSGGTSRLTQSRSPYSGGISCSLTLFGGLPSAMHAAGTRSVNSIHSLCHRQAQNNPHGSGEAARTFLESSRP